MFRLVGKQRRRQAPEQTLIWRVPAVRKLGIYSDLNFGTDIVVFCKYILTVEFFCKLRVHIPNQLAPSVEDAEPTVRVVGPDELSFDAIAFAIDGKCL